MTRELNVDPEALALAARGINDTIGGLNDMGALGAGKVGRGFSSIQLTGMEAGTPGLASAFADFLDRWSWGVRALVQDANTVARSLDLSAGIYHDEDIYIQGAFKAVGASTFADPHLTDQQIASQSWTELTESTKPDFSRQSWREAGSEMGHAWKSVGE